jgi:type VI secretion system protein ImpH
MEFPASQVRELQAPAVDSDPPVMTAAFMGLTGPLGVLPWHYTELLIELEQLKNPCLEEFFNLFNHRMISLFYRAWEKHHFFVSYERAPEKTDSLSQYLFDLIGMGTEGLRNRLSFPDHALLRYAGLIAQRPHSAVALRGILSDYFSVPVTVSDFAGKWFPLEPDGLSRLGEDSAHNQLGVDVVVGDAVWNQQALVRIEIGPLDIAKFEEFLPVGKGYRAIQDWLEFFLGRSTGFDIRLTLAAADVPACALSDEAPHPTRLGWASWLKTEEFVSDAREAVFSGVEEVYVT